MANGSMELLAAKEEKDMFSIKVRRVVAYIVLVLVSIMCLFWFYILFINATRTHDDLITGGFSFIPGTALIANFSSAIHSQLPIWNGLWNSFRIAALTAILSTYFSTMTAYSIHAYDYKMKKLVFTFIMAVMMIPTQVTALGFIRFMGSMNLLDTGIPLVVPAIAAPITFFYLKQYMESALPLEIVEAARIDGSNEFRTFNTIVLPMMKPAIAVQAIFTFVTSWNNYFTPALVLKTNTRKTLPILIAELRTTDWLKFNMGQVYMTIALSIFPVILVYILLSKFIVQGVALGSVKG